MDKLIFKKIKRDSEISAFAEKVKHYTGVDLPFQYLKKSEIVGAFSQDKMVAGYMLVTTPAFRSMMFLPDQLKSQDDFFRNDQYEMMEVNGLWIGPQVKSPKMQFRIWIRLLRDIFMCRKKYLLLMSNSNNKAIKKIHDLTNPTYLYEGNPQILGGEKTYDAVRVGYTTRWRMLKNIPRYFLELKKRESKVNPAFKERVYART